MSLVPILGKLFNGQSLEDAEMAEAMELIMDGKATPAQIGAFLAALRMKGETRIEIASAVRVIRSKASRVNCSRSDIVDTCGTGGDHSGTFNISTAAAFVAAGAGVAIAKHGNKNVSSACGSANVLQALGVNIDLSAEQVAASVDSVGMGFLFAPKHHGSFKYVVPVRQELGQRTIFNMLGPMLNPAGAKRQVIGVFNIGLTNIFADVLQQLGSEHVMVVAGTDGLDEISLMAPTRVAELKNNLIKEYVFNPQDLGFDFCKVTDLKGGDAPHNASILRGIFAGEKGPRRDIVALNAAAAIYVSGKAESLKDSLILAEKSMSEGAAAKILEKLVAFGT